MAYCAVGSISNADWAEIKKLCKQLRDEIDERFRQLDTESIQQLKEQVAAVEVSINALELGQSTQDGRLDKLEDTCANTELTTSEILEMYGGSNG